MGKPSWFVTLVTQMCLCLALFRALNVGQRQNKPILFNGAGRRPLDLYFISVRGGFRPLKQQTHLLKLMEKVAKKYKARFVVNTSELGEDDPLMQNGTWHFPSLKVPWYTTRVSKGHGGGYFLKQIKIPYGMTLDIIVLDTGSLQDLSSGTGNDQLRWLTRTLEATSSNWCIVVGFHSLAACDESNNQIQAKQIYEPLHHIFLKFGVNAYLSGQECTTHTHDESVAYIRNPSALDKEREMVNGFLLHRVTCLEIMTYFVASTGEVLHKKLLRQRGREVM